MIGAHSMSPCIGNMPLCIQRTVMLLQVSPCNGLQEESGVWPLHDHLHQSVPQKGLHHHPPVSSMLQTRTPQPVSCTRGPLHHLVPRVAHTPRPSQSITCGTACAQAVPLAPVNSLSHILRHAKPTSQDGRLLPSKLPGEARNHMSASGVTGHAARNVVRTAQQPPVHTSKLA